MFNQTISYITKECATWCHDQQYAFYSNYAQMFPKLAFLTAFIAVGWVEFGYHIIKRYPQLEKYDNKIMTALCYLVILFLLLYFFTIEYTLK